MKLHPTNPRTIVLSRDALRDIVSRARDNDPAVQAARAKRRALAYAARIDRMTARMLAGLVQNPSERED